ncbi:hypothetical protein BGAL_0112g00310 [Botrytis galanthina]|uniref:DUF7918 domain-containing protein n=1 Tax=Botrytis galanthina TaxID=278940 RepID=A0A4S8RAQ0_9HELO|nr:hypothetical protein BGAL_0112g00310 [Botrytis galanthina]
MGILTEEGNEYEVKIIDCATNQPFKEYVKLGDRESHGDSKCERYIVARPGAKFKIEVTLMSGFCFEPFQEVQAHFRLGNSNDMCAAYMFNKDKPEINDIKKDCKRFIECVNMARYGEDIVGAPFVFSSLDVDEDLSNETDIIGVDPADIGHFSVTVYRRTMEKEKIKTSREPSTKPSTDLWNAKKIGPVKLQKTWSWAKTRFRLWANVQANMFPPSQQFSISNTSTALSNFWIIWISFHIRHRFTIPLEITCNYRAAMGSERTTESEQSSSAIDCQSDFSIWQGTQRMAHLEQYAAIGEAECFFEAADQKAFERGEVKQQISCVPANKIIVLDDDGTATQPTHPRALAKIKREAQGLPNGIKREIETSYEVLTQRPSPNMPQNCKIKKEHVDRDHVDLSAEEPLAKRRKIKQEPIDMNVVNNVKIKQEPIDLDTLDEMAIVLKKQATIKYDLTELEDAIILPEPSTPRADLEESDYLEMAEEVLRQTADEFVRIRG